MTQRTDQPHTLNKSRRGKADAEILRPGTLGDFLGCCRKTAYAAAKTNPVLIRCRRDFGPGIGEGWSRTELIEELKKQPKAGGNNETSN